MHSPLRSQKARPGRAVGPFPPPMAWPTRASADSSPCTPNRKRGGHRKGQQEPADRKDDGDPHRAQSGKAEQQGEQRPARGLPEGGRRLRRGCVPGPGRLQIDLEIGAQALLPLTPHLGGQQQPRQRPHGEGRGQHRKGRSHAARRHIPKSDDPLSQRLHLS